MINWLIEKQVAFNQKDERAFIDNHRRAKWLWVRMALGIVLSLATMFYVQWRLPVGNIFDATVIVFFGLMVGRSLMGPIRRAGAYRAGWVRGRSAMVSSMYEAQQRGMSPEDWLTSEYERDLHIMW